MEKSSNIKSPAEADGYRLKKTYSSHDNGQKTLALTIKYNSGIIALEMTDSSFCASITQKTLAGFLSRTSGCNRKDVRFIAISEMRMVTISGGIYIRLDRNTGQSFANYRN
ncbi:hypothetical protein BDEG_27535 [Batrachochytrium dendrobatidis JEL423]|uniref:Uncharacterized protein n=1 Tax=Batrachochytrium dendrobatidis (strain JEL423) TaxID=403673 RepID=A0A177WXD3_BATDL|nr:hypothetical protein BDEG_27535 [Batrachochytrium dendrobatidis JEL423]